MSSIFGYTGEGQDLSKMADRLGHWKPDREGEYVSVKYSTGVLELYKTPECIQEPQPVQKDQIVVSLDGRIDNRKELAIMLPLEDDSLQADVNFVKEAYLRWGKDCVNYLVGAFVIAIWDEKENRLFIARDHLGIKPVYYSIVEEQLVYSSEMKGILALNSIQKTFNEQYVVSQFSSLVQEKDETLYEDIKTLPPGHFLTFSNGHLKVCEYWHLGKNKVEIPETVEEQMNKFGELFEQSVNSRLRTAGQLAGEVSGGIDSTGIAAFAMKKLGKGSPFYCYCYGKSEDVEKDDSDLVKEFARDYGIEDYVTVVDDNSLNGEEYLRYYNEILDDIDDNGVPIMATTFLPKAMSEGVNVLFSGWAGDQMVTSTAGGFFEAKANKRMYKSLWTGLRERYGIRKSILGWGYYILKSIYDPFYKKNLRRAKISLQRTVLNEELIEKYSLRELPHFRYYLKICTDIQSYQKINLTHTGIVDRTVSHGLIGKHFRIDYRFPMLDVRLLEYLQQLPFSTISPKGKSRYLFKSLIRGLVPDGVLSLHKSKVPTTPFSRLFFKKNEEQIQKELNDVDLDSLPFIRRDYNAKIHNKQIEIIHLSKINRINDSAK